MNRNYLISFIIFIFFYLTLSFVISFTFISQSVVNNNFISLEKYIDKTRLKENLFNDFNKFSQNNIKNIDKNIYLNNGQIEFTGELTSSFFIKIFSKLSDNFSKDFSDPRIMLYFYFNSNEIKDYLNQAIINRGNYTFKNYELEKLKEEVLTNNNKIDKINKNNKNFNLNFLKLLKRIKSTKYFFFISPIHFKISVIHQDIHFDVILKFNGLIWKIQKIFIPLNTLIDFNNINFQK